MMCVATLITFQKLKRCAHNSIFSCVCVFFFGLFKYKSKLYVQLVKVSLILFLAVLESLEHLFGAALRS